MDTPTSKVLSFSDLHFNSCYDPNIVEKLELSPLEEWEGIFRASSVKDFSTYGEDTNYPLFISFLTRIALCEDLDFVMFSGDFLGHNLRESYEKATADKTMAGYESFITKTFGYLVKKFGEYLPGKTIFPTLGNDDSFDGDYKIAPAGAFLSMVHTSWQPIFALPGSFKAGGYYSASIPGLENNKLIVLNNTFMSTRYPGQPSPDEASIQIEWLKKELAGSSGQNVWLMFHEPLGINIYPTIKNADYSDPHKVDIFLKKKYYTRLVGELKSLGEKCRILFSGHTHMDSYRLLHDAEGVPLIYNHITPAVSPIFGNNPAFQLFTIDNRSNFAQDYETIFLDLKNSSVQWKTEYTFSELYSKPVMTPRAMYDVWLKIGNTPAVQAGYKKFYDVSASVLPDRNWKVYYETMSEITGPDFAGRFEK